MSNPRFYYYPDPSGTLELIDLGEGLTDLQETPLASVEDASTGNGWPYRSFLSSSYLVKIVLERVPGTSGALALERNLRAMETHLQRGMFVGFSRDHSKSWCGVTGGGGNPARGDNILYTGWADNGFANWSSGATPAAGDEIMIEVPPPESNREIVICDTLSGVPGDVPVVDDIRYTYAQAAVVRWRDFYPVLFWPQNQVSTPIVKHEHRRTFTLEITLAYNPALVRYLFDGTVSGPGLKSALPASPGDSLETLLGRV